MNRSSRRCTASALVMTLAIIVMISALLVSFLSTMQLDRRSTANYSQQMRAKELAVGALQEITSQLQKEIDAGSIQDAKYTADGVRIYQPLANETVQPAKISFAASDYGNDLDPSKLPPTILQVSRYNATSPYPAIYDATKIPAAVASDIGSEILSTNRRKVTPERWNKPRLMAGSAQPPAPFVANPPDWVYVTRSGSRDCTLENIRDLKMDPLGTNDRAVTGRYAYVIYDEGALLDITVAGYPDGAKASNPGDVGGKSYVTYADLTQLPGISDSPSPQTIVDKITLWRNGARNGASYIEQVQKLARKGFKEFENGDNPLLNRQDLLSLFEKLESGGELGSLDALPYLGTFHRAATAPSWSPVTPTGSSIDYATTADTSTNRNLANLRISGAGISKHYDDEGNLVEESFTTGSLYLTRRFSLAKLAWLGTAGPNAAAFSPSVTPAQQLEAIKTCFGLQWDAAKKRWEYVALANPMPNGTTDVAIKTLDQAANEADADGKHREPNFFELLKSVILAGSLGRDPGAVVPNAQASPFAGPTGTLFDVYSSVKDAQIFRIGANIIDQYDSDRFPTTIFCNIFGGARPVDDAVNNSYFGIENLPYLHRLHQVCMATVAGRAATTTPVAAPIQGRMGGWLQPELWNPHHDISPTSTTGPTRLRIRTYGLATTKWGQTQRNTAGTGTWRGDPTTFNVNYGGIDPGVPEGPQFNFGVVTFNDSANFRANPIALSPTEADTSATDPICLFPFPVSEYPHVAASLRTNPFAAIFTGEAVTPYTPQGTDKDSFSPYARAGDTLQVRTESSEMTFVLEYEAAPNDWRPYSSISRFKMTDWNDLSNEKDGIKMVGRSSPKNFYLHVDPRTDRFSVCLDYSNSLNKSFSRNKTIEEDGTATGGHSIYKMFPRTTSGFSYSNNSSGAQRYVGDWQVNTTSARAYYADPDGVIRPGDGFRHELSTGNGCLTFHGGNTHGRRPIILDRPFRSVGELGFVFRDQPYKSLDFWSENSADAGLLDVFSLTDEPKVVGGQVNLSSSPSKVIEAILMGGSKKAIDPTLNLGTEVTALADAICAYRTNNGPLQNRANLAIDLRDSIQNAFASSSENKFNKNYAEAPMRSLVSIANTRTWNLLIDVIAQSGRITANADGLEDFMIEGEKRYWLHVAIDRYTGKILAQQLEPVYE